jgi:ubiquinone/menaquinone biosynthesis C-methylase UbiE
MKKSQISHWLRKLKLLYLTDFLVFHWQRFKNRHANRAFRQQFPDVKLPPDYLIYESFQIDYSKYYNESRDAAVWLSEHFARHIALQDRHILDWGCGPGRIIRHLPEVIGNGCTFYGTDYNEQSIAWCRANLPDIQFNLNPLHAELPYADQSMDVIYGISIFTHLSEKLHWEWFAELYRVLKPGGVLFLTTQGDHFRAKLIEEELAQYDAGNLVVRGQVKEGHRTYSAFHPPVFMRTLFSQAEVLEHIVRDALPGRALPQDIWMVTKP